MRLDGTLPSRYDTIYGLHKRAHIISAFYVDHTVLYALVSIVHVSAVCVQRRKDDAKEFKKY